MTTSGESAGENMAPAGQRWYNLFGDFARMTPDPHSSPSEAGPEHPISRAALPFKLKWLWYLLAGLAVIVAWKLLFPGGAAKAERDAQEAAALTSESLQYAQAGRYQECIDAARRALNLQPGLAIAYNNIGWCSAKLGNLAEGIRNIQEALRIDPRMAVAAGNLAWMQKEKAKAPSSSSATTPTPGDPEVISSLQHAQAGRYRECIEAGRRALQINPNQALAYNNIGWCAAKLGRWNEGIENTRAALRVQPDLQIAANNLRWMLDEKAKAGGSLPPARR